MQVTLTGLKQPGQRIQTIKALRAATPRVLGLKEAKEIADGLLPYMPNNPYGAKDPISHTLEVRDPRELDDWFIYTTISSYDDIPKRNYAQRAEHLKAMGRELLNADHQYADREQHLSVAEGLLTLHGRLMIMFDDKNLTADATSIEFMLKRAELHVQIAGFRL